MLISSNSFIMIKKLYLIIYFCIIIQTLYYSLVKQSILYSIAAIWLYLIKVYAKVYLGFGKEYIEKLLSF